ncbi:MAG TPA: ATP-binding protein [Cyclobacteriaceae bacterium]|nr:ATP-binding protein [Cyclobacteriaceae bacterium]
MKTLPIAYAENELPPGQALIDTKNNRAFETFVTILTDEKSSPTIGCVTGISGVGKTIAIEKYMQQYVKGFIVGLPSVIALKIPTNATARTVASELARSLGEKPPRSGNKHDIAEMVTRIIENNGVKLIFVDEADRLNRESFDIIRYVFDRTGCKFVIVGLPDVLNVIERHQQFSSRAGLRMKFERPDLDEVLSTILPNMVVPQWKYHPNDDADRKMGILAWEMSGNFRRLRNLLERAGSLCRLLKSPYITEEILRSIFQYTGNYHEQQFLSEPTYSDGLLENRSEKRRDAKFPS